MLLSRPQHSSVEGSGARGRGERVVLECRPRPLEQRPQGFQPHRSGRNVSRRSRSTRSPLKVPTDAHSTGAAQILGVDAGQSHGDGDQEPKLQRSAVHVEKATSNQSLQEKQDDRFAQIEQLVGAFRGRESRPHRRMGRSHEEQEAVDVVRIADTEDEIDVAVFDEERHVHFQDDSVKISSPGEFRPGDQTQETNRR